MAPNDHDDDPVQSEESDSSDADDLTEDELLALQGIKYETDTGGHRLGLYVAALFQKLEGHPDAYKDFFDPAIKSIKFLRFSKEKSGHLSMMIWRKGNIVVTGFYETWGDKDYISWDDVSHSKLKSHPTRTGQ